MDGGCRGLREVEAESVAYMATSAHGLDSGQYTFRYVTGWATQAADGSSPEDVVRATGQRFTEVADRILAHTQADAVRPAEEALQALEADMDRTINTGSEPIRSAYVSGAAHERMTPRHAPDHALAVRR